MCVDPPLCRGISQGTHGSCAKDLVCVGEIVGQIGEVGGRELVACRQCQVRQRTRHDTWITIFLDTDVQILSPSSS